MRTEEAPAARTLQTRAGGAGRTERDDIVRGLRYVAGVFLSVRVGLFVVALAGVALLPGLKSVGVPGWPAPPPPADLGWHNLFVAWERFDALWFLRIATAGYAAGDGTAVFSPARSRCSTS